MGPFSRDYGIVLFPVQFFGSNFLQCAKREGIDLVMLMRSGRQRVDREWAGLGLSFGTHKLGIDHPRVD